MQMEEASEHRPGDYGRWESSLWSPWHQGSHFFFFLARGGGGDFWGLVGRLGEEAGGSLSPSEEEEDGEGRKREGRACHGIIPSHAPAPYAPPTTPFQIKKKKQRGGIKSISRVRGICVIY